jgi:hypothetical protein
MMKHLLLLLALTLSALPAVAQETPVAREDLLVEPMPGSDVRWFIWGVPPDDVIKYEKVILFEEVNGTLFFVDDVYGIKTLISYEFYKNRLWRVTYDFQKDDYPNPQTVIDDYVSTEIMMNKRFGEPKARETLWKNDYYKDKHNRWGLAVYNGYLELRMMWENERTQAVMSLKAEDYDYKFRIVHTSRAIEAEMKAEQLKDDLSVPTPAPALKAAP